MDAIREAALCKRALLHTYRLFESDLGANIPDTGAGGSIDPTCSREGLNKGAFAAKSRLVSILWIRSA